MVRGRTRLRGEDLELDLGGYQFRRFGRRVKLEKKPMELLILLVSRRDQLVSREDIVKRLWRSDLFIDTEHNVNNIVRKLRTALGDDFGKSRFIETVVGKGYRFVGPVRVIDAPSPGQAAEPRTPFAALDHPGGWSESRPSLVVLPLLVLGKVADEQGIALGIVDALIARLSSLKDLDVLPTAVALNVPPDSAAPDVALRLGVRFVIHGAIQMSKGQWRLSLTMFDARLQRPCWARKCDIEMSRHFELESDLAKQIAGTLNRPLGVTPFPQRARYSNDPLAYAEFMRGYRLSASGEPAAVERAIHHLTEAVSRDATFARAHATLSVACTSRHFEHDPSSVWLEKAEFHCRRSLEIDPDLPEGHVARAFLLWGPSKNFQHLEAIVELKRALALQGNLAHAYNRLGTILSHVGLLDQARQMYERGRHFNPGRTVSHSIVQVYVWNREYDLAREEIEAWRKESPGNKYAIYFAPQPAMMTGDWDDAEILLDEAQRLLPGEPLIISLQGVFYSLLGKPETALECVARACASPRSFGHAHHTYYQIACVYALTGQATTALEWLERSVGSGFACWPFFLKDPCLAGLHGLPEFHLLVSSLQAKYPSALGVL